MPKQYIANERVRHSVTRKYYQVGEVIPVDHLSPAQLAALVDRGVLREVDAAEPVKIETVEPITPATPTIEESFTRARPGRKVEEVKDNG